MNASSDYSDKLKRLRSERRRVLEDIQSCKSEKIRKRLYGAVATLDGIISRYERKHTEFILFRRFSVLATKRDGNLSKFITWYESNGFSCIV